MMTEIVLVRKAVSKVFGDFVSKVVSDGVDVLKSAIKDADLDRKSYNQHLQTRLYQLIVDALNRFTYNKYEKQDKLYAAAESILKGYISTQDNVDAVKSGLKMLVSDVNIDTCQEFLETLCGEICSDDNNDLYKEIDVLWKRRESEYIHGEFAKIGQNDREILEQLNDLRKVLDFIKRNMNRQEGDKVKYNDIPIVNRAEEYAGKWDKNVFLNDFNEEDENAGINIKLREIYVEECLPYYIWKNNTKSSNKLRNLLTRRINEFNNEKMLLILGQPGIGKSTLITWIMANFAEKKDKFLVYQFASDLGNVNWQGNHILNEILNVLNLDGDNLENKVLILDGFDEICINRDREKILNILYRELKQTFWMKKFILIITCRENYVEKSGLGEIEYITLQAWDEEQIRSFCEIYEEVIISKDSEAIVNRNSEVKIRKIIEKKDIMGIPLILYMVLALNVDIGKSSSTVDIYDQIFSLKRGGIYDRSYDVEHRINASEIKKHIHHISQQIAFWMFENNADKATILQEKFEEICENEMGELGENGEDIQSDALIGNFFRLNHCEGEGTDELQFVHRSIYEYFVVAYFYDSIYKLESKEAVAGKLGELLKDGHLSEQILKFIKYKFESMIGLKFSFIIEEVFNIMLKDGMTFYTQKNYKNIFKREMNIFSNMLEIIHLWKPELGEYDDKMMSYLRYGNWDSLNLKGIILEKAYLARTNLVGANLSEAGLSEADLSGANLMVVNLNGADLSEADLSGANLISINLSGANLRGADLSGSNLISADLKKADLSGVNLRGANLSGADLNGAILSETLFEEGEVDLYCKIYDLSNCRVYINKFENSISYKEYCARKQR